MGIQDSTTLLSLAENDGVGPRFLPATTLCDLLLQRLHEDPDAPLYVFVEKTLADGVSLSARDLVSRASKVAAHLRKSNPQRTPVLLLYNCDLDYLVAFFGCLLAGQIAVPAYPPTASKHFDRLSAIVESSGAGIALVSPVIQNLMRLVDTEKMLGLPVKYLALDSKSLDRERSIDVPDVSIHPSDIAFLQYTSGSTGQPKGVMLSHAALLANTNMIRANYGHSSKDRLAMWLPLYHDMGLIGGVLMALLIRAPLYFMPPQSIVRPFRWLKLLTDLKATISGGPNFAFEMCLHRISDDELKQLDLSSLRFFASGAEPVRSQTVEKFYERFGQVGLRPNVILPCYGLAEVCLYGLSQKVGAPIQKMSVDPNILQIEGRAVAPKNVAPIEYVSCGILKANNASPVVNPETLEPCKPYEVGELLLTGAHMMTGYWKNPEATAKAFVLWRGQKYVRTGDLVFFDETNNVYFCGRSKDMIIVRGKNYFAPDLEISASKSHPELAGLVNASFSYDHVETEGVTEKVVVVQELPLKDWSEDTLEQIQQAIRQQILDDHGLAIDELLFVKTGTVKRTSAGKVRRLATRDLFLQGELRRLQDEIVLPRWRRELPNQSKNVKVVMMLNYIKLKIALENWKASVSQSILRKDLLRDAKRAEAAKWTGDR